MYVGKRSTRSTKKRGMSSAKRSKRRATAQSAQSRRRLKKARRKEALEEALRHLHAHNAKTRYWHRREHFVEQRGAVVGAALHAFLWVLHNCVAHPVLGLFPGSVGLYVHDRTADWLNMVPTPTQSSPPEITDRRAWFFHNCVAHPLMGLAPLGIWFDLHETSAQDMNVEGWA